MSKHIPDTRGRRGAQLPAVRRLRRAGAIGSALMLLSGTAAQATTGNSALNHPPKFKVTAAQAKPFLGKYKLSAHGSGILGSSFRTGYNSAGYLEGSISVRQYSEGVPATWMATLYEYRRSGQKMIADLWTPDLGSAILGHLTVKRMKGGRLTGTIQLGQKKIRVTYKAAA